MEAIRWVLFIFNNKYCEMKMGSLFFQIFPLMINTLLHSFKLFLRVVFPPAEHGFWMLQLILRRSKTFISQLSFDFREQEVRGWQIGIVGWTSIQCYGCSKIHIFVEMCEISHCHYGEWFISGSSSCEFRWRFPANIWSCTTQNWPSYVDSFGRRIGILF